MPLKLIMLPPQTLVTREWATRLSQLPDVSVVIAENEQQARKEIVDADAAYGTLTPEILQNAGRLRWVQAPHAGPKAGYYFPELIAHELTVTNFREIYNDIVGTQIMAYVFDLPDLLIQA